MARLNVAAAQNVARDSINNRKSTPLHASSAHNTPKASALTPSEDTSSDKENQDELTTRPSLHKKSHRSGTTATSLPTPPPQSSTQKGGSKRKRIGEYSITDTEASGAQMDERDGASTDLNKYYDPDQAPEVRRRVRKDMRDLSRFVHDSRDQLLAADNNELYDAVQKSNELMGEVRQTADATIDSRFLVTATDITLKKTTQVVLGDSAAGVDLDEFVSKCISFMRYGAPGADGDEVSSSSATRNRNRRVVEDDGVEGDDEGDALNWEILGSRVCFPANARPPVPSFLLGPLSSQKRVRVSQTRRAPLRMNTETAAVSKPEELAAADLDRGKASNLTTLCNAIHSQLRRVIEDGMTNVDAEGDSDMEDEEIQALMQKHHVTPEGHVPLFDFALHPDSFGQTVENLFYISFLVREGSVAIGKDSDGLPTLYPNTARTLAEQRAQNASKYQAVFSLDWATWRGLVETFGIKEPLIPHRQYDELVVQPQGWYG